jgi:hypothetical protein
VVEAGTVVVGIAVVVVVVTSVVVVEPGTVVVDASVVVPAMGDPQAVTTSSNTAAARMECDLMGMRRSRGPFRVTPLRPV